MKTLPPQVDAHIYDSCYNYVQLLIRQQMSYPTVPSCCGDEYIIEVCKTCKFYYLHVDD